MRLPHRPRSASWATVLAQICLLSWASVGNATPLGDSWTQVADALQREQQRALQLHTKGRAHPYLAATHYAAIRSYHVEASLGAVVSEGPAELHVALPMLRVGSPQLDNSNFSPSDDEVGGPALLRVPLESAPGALEYALWPAFDAAYRVASDALEQKQSARASATLSYPPPVDFAPAPVVRAGGGQALTLPVLDDLRAAAVAGSSELSHVGIQSSGVTISAWCDERVFVSTEGARAYEATSLVEVRIHAETQAPDGMPLRTVESFLLAREQGELHVVDVVRRAARRVRDGTLEALQAPLMEDYSGPVLFEDGAAPQFFYDVLSPQLSGTPVADLEPPAWGRRIGKRVLPSFLSVLDDPTVSKLQESIVAGHYGFDEQGVAPLGVELIRSGRLETLLMSRAANRYLSGSTGHARSGLSGVPRAHVGHLLVRNHRPSSRAALRSRLLGIAREQGLEYALIIRAMEPRGYASGGGALPAPLAIYRLYPDGRQERVRGGTLLEVVPRQLRDIVSAGSQLHVLNLRVETGALPLMVTASVPDLLFEELELRTPAGGFPLLKRIPQPAPISPQAAH